MQPLSSNTSCNLGSINLFEFLTEDNRFDYEAFKNQIIRGIYYLDLVIDASKYPLSIIERRTKAIRPVGLGIMGLADTAIKMGIKYGSPEFLDFCDKIGAYLAKYSLIASIELGKQKGSFKECPCVIDLLNQNVNYNNLIDSLNLKDVKYNDLSQEELDGYNWVNKFIDKNPDILLEILENIRNQLLEEDNTIPNTFKNALTLIEDDKYILDLFNTGLRNSRRLSIAPTGTLSMILNTSSAIEPNFAFEWDRYVVDTNGTDRVLKKYYHKLNTPENREKGLLLTANELSWKDHLEVVRIFAKYTDSAISKTVNFSSDAKVEDIKEAYIYCFDNNIKGTTVYRDKSRDSQPIIAKNTKEKNTEDNIKTVDVIKEDYSLTDLPQWLPAIRTKCSTPIGSVYVITTLYNSKPCEIYISAGKSGSQVKSMIESLSRVISIGLRSGVDINNIIKTLIGITENESYIYETINGEEEWIGSTPDLIAHIIKDTIDLIGDKNRLIKLFENIGIIINKQILNNNSNMLINTKIKEVINNTDKSICPKCGSKMIRESGCYRCMNCYYSPCG